VDSVTKWDQMGLSGVGGGGGGALLFRELQL
jgi:hypothetical protein